MVLSELLPATWRRVDAVVRITGCTRPSGPSSDPSTTREHHRMITAADAEFHQPDSDDPTWGETNFFGFYSAEEPLNVGIYTLFRPNLGVVLSTISMNSGDAIQPWRADFCDHQAQLPIPEPTVAGQLHPDQRPVRAYRRAQRGVGDRLRRRAGHHHRRHLPCADAGRSTSMTRQWIRSPRRSRRRPGCRRSRRRGERVRLGDRLQRSLRPDRARHRRGGAARPADRRSTASPPWITAGGRGRSAAART